MYLKKKKKVLLQYQVTLLIFSDYDEDQTCIKSDFCFESVMCDYHDDYLMTIKTQKRKKRIILSS